MPFELSTPTHTLLAEIADPAMKRADVAKTYALVLHRDDVDWAKVNAAIIERWSRAALKWIKEQAWKAK